MDSLPSSIEAYLAESGFTGSEIMILKKLFEGEALTLRELAAKTGKSTGTLDQAMKKMMQKGIVRAETINDTTKYMIHSLQSVLGMMEQEVRKQQQMIEFKFQNFETFVSTIQQAKQRPEMEHFEGVAGIKKAYKELLNRGNDLVQYGPTLWLAEDDPLRDFRVQYFRERHKHSIFSRVITHNTVLGRRFQSRDPYEYRKTILVDPELYPFTFEKIIVGDTVACFQLEDDIACFIRFPELAQEERVFFDRIWNKKVDSAKKPAPEPPKDAPQLLPAPASMDIIDIPVRTKTLSSLREFFLGRKSLASFAIFGILAGAITFGLYRHNISLNTKRIQERVRSIAATGALQFEAEDLEELHTSEDIKKPQYKKVIYQLNLIRNQNEGVKYAYLMRPTNEYKKIWEFIADADSLDPYTKKDLNGDRVIDEADHLSPPGEPYDVSDQSIDREMFEATASIEPHTDQWGTWISGWAPVKDKNGVGVGILGVDISANEIENLTHRAFIPLYYFIGFFLLFLLVRLAAFNRSLFQELCDICKARRMLLAFTGGFIFVLLLSVALFLYERQSVIESERAKILSIATTGALQFSANELNLLRSLKDINTPVYDKVIATLHNIRLGNDNIKYAYLIRPTPNSTTFEFIADADAYGLDLFLKNDINEDGIVNGEDEVVYPGLPYDISYIEVLKNGRYYMPVVTQNPYEDKWGKVLTGYAPIKDDSDTIVGILAIDTDVQQMMPWRWGLFLPIIAYLVVCVVYLLFRVPGYRYSLFYRLWKIVARRKVIVPTLFVFMGIYWLSFAWYFYTLHLVKEETGKRLMAIAATAASQINAEDLESLKFARDMKRPEYQRVFKKLSEIRNNNPDILYIYIFRPTETEGIWEFVADADSNYYIPDYYDNNEDGILDEQDENISPGVRYSQDLKSSIYNEGLIRPTYEREYLTDQWGTFISGSAPIFDQSGKAIAILEIDIYAKSLFE